MKSSNVTDSQNETIGFYYFNPCKPFNMPEDPYISEGDQCHNVLACYQMIKKNKYFYYPMAIQMNSSIETSSKMKGDLIIKYFGARSYSNSSMYVLFQCDRRSHKAVFKFDSYLDRIPLFVLTHRWQFPDGLLLLLLFVICFIVATAVFIFYQCRRHYPERNVYGAVGQMDIHTMRSTYNRLTTDHNQSTKRVLRSKASLPVLDNLNISSQDFKIVKRLCAGELGEVNEGRWNDKLVAIKTLRLGVHADKFTKNDTNYLQNEIGILSRLRNKNLTAIIGVCFDDVTYPTLIMQFNEHGTIIDFIKRFPDRIDWSLRIKWCTNAVDAMLYLHGQKILHRNLKGSNILVGVDLRAQICDFGLIKILQPLRAACENECCLCTLTAPSLPVSIRWTAPECLLEPRNPKNFAPPCDVYSFGVCLWEMYKLEQPYADIKDENEASKMIVSGTRLYSPGPPDLMPQYHELMQMCWEFNPNERPTFQQISISLRESLPKAKQYQRQLDKQINNNGHPEEIHRLLSATDSTSQSTLHLSSQNNETFTAFSSSM
ncbi:unnamed protein product [Didymodactylos carnosus]|uniref:Protein kinase domain-containing protein n=1 Tax=Didymodactylos carnosus TaxID=1234261 RepID=A0A813ZA27_9BILA|nr:unnamed protein product [Didymodactylos carnosus]CAF0895338.1 unnamed protein product [Didymodactylos carnosus]CAF3662541.1 unnamed protein product [Didymodactylos carnosus]CAF3678801.1 unnamed protein product [Didymodactylos carnosus]